jgi:hypothetical protein
LAWVWRQNLAPSGKVFGSVFLLEGKKSIGHSCVGAKKQELRSNAIGLPNM